MQSNAFFATARPMRLFLKVAIPGMISMLAMSIYNIVEGIFIGNLLGEAAFAAINIGMPFLMINFSLADLVGVGSSVPISIALGRKDSRTANNIFSCSMILIELAATFMGIIMFICSPMLVKLMGAEGELAELAVKYVRIAAAAGPLCTPLFAMDNFLRISGFVKGSMLLNIFMSVMQIAMLALLLGAVGMGVEGAALATASAMAVCTFIAVIPFLRKKTVLVFVKPHFSLAMLKEIVSCGAPTFLNNIAGRLASILMNSALLRLGGQTAVATYSVLMYAGGIVEPMLYGMCDSISPAIGYNWGARALERVRDITKCAISVCGCLSFIGAVVMFVFAEPITGIFVAEGDGMLQEMSTHAMRIYCISYMFRWFSFAVQAFYSAIEKPMPASILSVCSAMVFPILFIFALQPMGLDGLWLNSGATAIVVMIMAIVMLRISQKTMREDIMKPGRAHK